MEKIILSTILGQINYLRNLPDKFSIKIYLDDFIYQNSLFLKVNKINLHQFLNTNRTIYIDSKNKEQVITKNGKKSILSSIHGNFFYTKSDYKNIISKISDDDVQIFDFDTKELLINGKQFIEPVSLNDFIDKFNNFDGYIGTNFMNTLVDEQKLIFYQNNEFVVKYIDDCNGLEYIKYICSINEINGKIYICEHNFKTLFKYILNKNDNNQIINK
ncbi:hypothetical protein EBI_26692 [Enterocytozoon bieneusi H348]|nr:hypothetical protein EBI_26692 [Enterocytozoon bieneusi H348]|eukprot:XP_002650225.1 hypothetical protein EBI_26692 [Enterocytozoon bieneusi H348]